MGKGGDWVSKVFHMLNICLSMSKYPLGSNLRGTGGLGMGLGLGFWVRVFHMLNMCLSTSKYPESFKTGVFLRQSIL